MKLCDLDEALKFQWNFIDGWGENRKKVNVKRGKERDRHTRWIDRLRVLLSFMKYLSTSKEKIERKWMAKEGEREREEERKDKRGKERDRQMDKQIDRPLKFWWNFIDGGRENRKKINVKRGKERHRHTRWIDRLRGLLSFMKYLSMSKEKIERKWMIKEEEEEERERETKKETDKWIDRLIDLLSFNEILSMGEEKIERKWMIKEKEAKRERQTYPMDRKIEGPLKFHEIFIDE
jgi:hypothetical protein